MNRKLSHQEKQNTYPHLKNCNQVTTIHNKGNKEHDKTLNKTPLFFNMKRNVQIVMSNRKSFDRKFRYSIQNKVTIDKNV